MNNKETMPPPYYGTPPSAPPTYAQAVGGVPPSSPYVPNHACKYDVLYFYYCYLVGWLAFGDHKRLDIDVVWT